MTVAKRTGAAKRGKSTFSPRPQGDRLGTWAHFVLPVTEQQSLYNAFNFLANNTTGTTLNTDLRYLARPTSRCVAVES